jgi:hypothetical protein
VRDKISETRVGQTAWDFSFDSASICVLQHAAIAVTKYPHSELLLITHAPTADRVGPARPSQTKTEGQWPMGFYYHPVEEHQYGVVMAYEEDHPGASYLIEFTDGEAYTCQLCTAYQSENGGELDIEMDDPRYDEFYQVVFEVIEPVRAGETPVQRVSEHRLPRLPGQDH